MLDTVRLVDENVRSTTHSNFPRSFINRHSLECLGLVHIDGLKEGLRTGEDNKRMPGNVHLRENAKANKGQRSS
jgi:hypothetical protein